jgi:transposase-like protein
MTKRVNRPHRKRGRVPKVAPATAAARIAALAATGHSVVGIARGLNTSTDTLRRWLDDDPALAEALARGRESERLALHNILFRAARKGNIIAAMFLLKARHGYREGDQSGEANRVSITFALPGALTPEQFTIEHAPRTENLPVSGKSLTRS